MPQVEVTFDIDAERHSERVGQGQGPRAGTEDRHQGFQRPAASRKSSAWSSDAEAHAEEDKQFRELVEARNRGDALMHATEKSLKDLGEKVTSEERYKIETAISALKTALGGDDKDAIESRSQELAQASAAIAQRAYAQQEARVRQAQSPVHQPAAVGPVAAVATRMM